MGLLLLLVLIGIAILWIIHRSRNRPRPHEMYEACISGNGKFAIEVVGESHYQSAIASIEERCGRGWDDEDELFAFIVPEPNNQYDRNACAVYIENQKVGHLSRQNAKEFRAQIGAEQTRAYRRFRVQARLVGGTRGKPNFGVILDLPAGD